MAEKGKVQQVQDTTDRLEEHLLAMANLTVADDGVLVSREIATFEAAAPRPTDEEAAPVPAPAPEPEPEPEPAPVQMPPPEISVDEVPKEEVGKVPSLTAEEAPLAAVERELAVSDNAVQAKLGLRDNGDDELDRQERLIKLLLERAEENPEALEKALE